MTENPTKSGRLTTFIGPAYGSLRSRLTIFIGGLQLPLGRLTTFIGRGLLTRCLPAYNFHWRLTTFIGRGLLTRPPGLQLSLVAWPAYNFHWAGLSNSLPPSLQLSLSGAYNFRCPRLTTYIGGLTNSLPPGLQLSLGGTTFGLTTERCRQLSGGPFVCLQLWAAKNTNFQAVPLSLAASRLQLSSGG